MERAKKGLFCVLMCVFLLGGGVGYVGAESAPIKIGYVSSFTGPIGEFANRIYLNFKMVIEEANKAGGLAGRQVEIVVRDDKVNAADHARLARDLVYSEKVDLLAGATTSMTSLSVAGVAKETKTPTLVMTTAGAGSSTQRNRYVFRANAYYKVQTGTMTGIAVKKGWKKFALVNQDYAYGHAFGDGLKEGLARIPGSEIKVDLYPKFGALDYSPYITKLMATDLDAIISGLYGSDVTSFLKQGLPYGLFKKLPLVIFIQQEDLEALGKDMPEGIYGFSHFYAWIPTKKAQKYAQDFHNYTGKYPSLDYNGYVNALLYVEAVRKAGTADKEAVINAMEGISFDTPTGRMTIRPFDHQLTLPGVIGRTVHKPEYPNFAVMEDFYMPDAEQFLPTKEEIEKLPLF